MLKCRLKLLLTCIAAALTSSATIPATAAPAPTGTCRLVTPEDWRHFLEYYADEDGWTETCEDSTCDAQFYEYVVEHLKEPFKACAGFLEQHPAIARCTDRMRRFTAAWMAQHDDDSNGFIVDNLAYLKAQGAPDLPPGMTVPPQQIIDALPDRDAVEAVARRSGWRYLTHDSAIEGVRTFILVPDPAGRFDLWILLNLPNNASMIDSKMPLSVLAVQKKTSAGSPLKKVRLYFRDYLVRVDGAGHYGIATNYSANGKCYSCHPNGVRQLIARRTHVLEALPVKGEPGYDPSVAKQASDDFALQRLHEFNRKLRSYGSPDWTGQIRPEDHGPMLGAAEGCTDCHDGVSRAALNLSTSMRQIAQKMLFELSMPPDSDYPKLLEKEQWQQLVHGSPERLRLARAALAQKVDVETFADARSTALKEWFLEVPCR
jgi:hypothetical protein